MIAWIGKSIIFIGIVHSVFGFVVFRPVIAEIVRGGLINTVNGEPEREFAFWFLFFGFMAMIVGSVIDWCERKHGTIPGSFGWMLLGLTILLVTIMPASGGWAVLLPAVGAIYRSLRSSLTLDIDGSIDI